MEPRSQFNSLMCLDLEGGPNSVEFVQPKKFGEIAECSAVRGGLLTGADEDEIRRLRRYGRVVGVPYRVVDDILKEKGVETTEGSVEERSGKKKGKRLMSGFTGSRSRRRLLRSSGVRPRKNSTGSRSMAIGSFLFTVFVDYTADRGFTMGGPS